MKKGVLLIGVGHKNYLHMAEVLAASIRVNDKGLDISIVTNHAIPDNQKFLFDKVIPLDVKQITIKGELHYIKSKLLMYDLSPYDETIFLDVDQVLIPKKKISVLFDQLADVDFTMSNTGISDESIWAEITEVQKLYGDVPFWNYHSELVYFKKTDAVKKYFNAAKKAYSDNKVKSAVKFSGGHMADELAFQIASMVTGLYPHAERWTPNFWYEREPLKNRKYPYELTEHITYSIGGNTIPPAIKANYNNLAKSYFATLGLSNPYQVVDKRSFLPERKLI